MRENPTFVFAYLGNMASYELFLQVLVSVVILASGIQEDGGSGTCSAGDSCGVNDSPHQNQGLERLLSETTANRLIRTQTEVAKYFEIGYLAVGDFPDLSKEVRLRAHEAKSQHMMTVDLMTDYMTTAKHILDDLLPLVQRAVETQDKDLFVKLLQRIEEIADRMRKGAHDAKDEYSKIHIRIESLIGNIQGRKKDVEEEKEEIQMTKKKNLNYKEEKEKDESQIEDDLEEVESKIQDLESEAKEMKDSIDNHGWIKGGRKIAETLVSGISTLFGFRRLTSLKSTTSSIFDSFEIKESRYKEALNEIAKQKERRRTLNKQLNTIRRQKLDILEDIQRLDLKKFQMGDIKSLERAYDGIASTTELFDKIERFWGRMINEINTMASKTTTAKIFTPDKAGESKTDYISPYIEMANQWWSQLGKMCLFYIKKSEHEESTKISNLYKFMTYPLSMTQEERQERINKIATDLHYTLTQEISGDD